MKKYFLIFLIFASGFLKAQTVNPDSVKFVSPTYSNTSPFFSTIQAAINNSGAGTLVIVYPGTYNESITLKDSVNLHLNQGVKITRSSGNTVSFSGSTHLNVTIAGEGIIENTGSGYAVNFTSSSGGTANNSKLYIKCAEILSATNTAFNVSVSSSSTEINVKCRKIFSSGSTGIWGATNTNNTGQFFLTCDSIRSNHNTSAPLNIRTGVFDFNVKHLLGNYTVLNVENANMMYHGYDAVSMNDTGHALKVGSNGIGTTSSTFYGSINKLYSNSILHSTIEVINKSYANLIAQDSIINLAACVNTHPEDKLILNAGYILNNRNTTGFGETLWLLGSGVINAKEVRNLGNTCVIYGQVKQTDLFTVSAKLIGNTVNNLGVVVSDSTDYTAGGNLVLRNCVIYNANSSGLSVGTNGSGVTPRYLRIYGSLFTNVQKQYSLDFLTGTATQMYYVK